MNIFERIGIKKGFKPEPKPSSDSQGNNALTPDQVRKIEDEFAGLIEGIVRPHFDKEKPPVLVSARQSILTHETLVGDDKNTDKTRRNFECRIRIEPDRVVITGEGNVSMSSWRYDYLTSQDTCPTIFSHKVLNQVTLDRGEDNTLRVTEIRHKGEIVTHINEERRSAIRKTDHVKETSFTSISLEDAEEDELEARLTVISDINRTFLNPDKIGFIPQPQTHVIR